jgi:hypothetical protein
MSYTCNVIIISTLDTDELFRPVQVITVPSRLLVTFIIVIVDTKGSAPREETRAKVKLAEFISIGEILSTPYTPHSQASLHHMYNIMYNVMYSLVQSMKQLWIVLL